MSLLKTKPIWAPSAVATSLGWQDPVTKEVFVSIRGLDARLAAEHAKSAPAPVVEVAEPVNPDLVYPGGGYLPPVVSQESIVEEKVNEVIIEKQETPEVVQVKVPAKRGPKPKVKVNEVVEQPAGLQVIGEVVEEQFLGQVIGE